MEYPVAYGDYVLLERLGLGGMSQVDLARKGSDEEFVRFLVIKRIKAERTSDDAFVRMFRDEARITSELHHANIASVYDFGRMGDEYFMALEYVPGVDVRVIVNTLRERGQGVPPSVALRITYDVLQALQYAHTKVDSYGTPMRIVHRDVNPRNIMVSIRGETKLIDFGVARATGRLERTRTDHVKGKFAYMAPEQMSNDDIDGRADLFAVGLTLYELVRGFGPFHGLSQVQIMHRLVGGRIPPLEGPTPGYDGDLLRTVFARSTAMQVKDRYPDAAAFAKDVERLASMSGGLASQADMERFLRYLQPDLAERVQQKMTLFSAPLVDVQRYLNTSEPVVTEEVGGTMSGVRQMTASVGPTVTGTVIAAGGAFAGAMVVVLALFAVLGAAAAYMLWHPADGPPLPMPQPVTSAEPPVVAPPVVAPPVTPPVEATALVTPRDPVIVAQPSVPDKPPAVHTPKEPVVTTAVAVATPPVVVPGTDAPIVAAEVATEAEVADAPPGDIGVVQVASSVRGRAITVDGHATGDVTPKALELPVGVHTIAVDGYAAAQVDVGKNQRKPLVFR